MDNEQKRAAVRRALIVLVVAGVLLVVEMTAVAVVRDRGDDGPFGDRIRNRTEHRFPGAGDRDDEGNHPWAGRSGDQGRGNDGADDQDKDPRRFPGRGDGQGRGQGQGRGPADERQVLPTTTSTTTAPTTTALGGA